MAEPTPSSEATTRPEDVVGQARARAAAMRGDGRYAEEFSRPLATPGPAGSPVDRLLTWALIAPSEDERGSGRLGGAAVLAVKRVLLRLLRHYHAELIGKQARFNVEAAVRLEALEQRMDELERRVER